MYTGDEITPSETPQPRNVDTTTGEIIEPSGTITAAQQKRFFAIATKAGWTKDELKGWLQTHYGIEHSRDIPRDRYEELCTAVEHGQDEGEADG